MRPFWVLHHWYGMKLSKLPIAILFLSSVLTQNCQAQINELKKAQEKREKYVGSSSLSGYTPKSHYVNTFIGTGGHGHTYPGASMPFGMIQLSPDTRHEGWDACSGYHYSDSVIYGFSHTHLSGTGVPDYCDLLIVPQSGKMKTEPGYLVQNGYGSHFSHSNETAQPGGYTVHLDDGNIDVELAVTKRCGFHEYTFNEVAGKYILLDLDHRDKVLDAGFKLIDKQTISGRRISQSWAKEQHFYFHIELDVPYKKAKYIDYNGRHKLLLIFPTNTTKVRLKVGISAVDQDGAANNLHQEIPAWDILAIKAAALKEWNRELDKIHFVSADKEVMTNFYTALYHSYLNPNLFNDVDGRYRGRDNMIHELSKDEGDQYTVFSLWDTYRATHPLFTLTQEERTNHFVRTFLRQYEQGGDLPVWELSANETECMIGYHSVSVIADAYMKGIRDYDSKKALKAMMATSALDEFGKHHFHQKGFISSGDEPESVSKTLEYAYDEFCIAQMASELALEGSEYDFRKHYKAALNFINIYDPESGFMRARREGIWHSPFNPAEVNFNYTEANSWQYSLYAPHAVSILAEHMGGKDSLEHWLDRLFTTESNLSGRHQVDITGLIGQYAHGNEPSHHMAYLYNYTNAPHKTQFYTDKILREMYHNAPDGLSGNEDCGQMSSWYVLSAMGLYQIAPGHPWYDFGRPIMDEVIIQLNNKRKLIIKALNNSIENKYIQSIKWNGAALNTNGIAHSTLAQGGILVFDMGSEPLPTPLQPNISAMGIDEQYNFVPLPFFTETETVFDDSLLIAIGAHRTPVEFETLIEYRFKESPEQILLYEDPISIQDSKEIEARQIYSFIYQGDTIVNSSGWVSAKYAKRDKSLSLKLFSVYDDQYAAAGSNTLIDGVRGNKEYRTGDWQGYWATDITGEVEFETARTITEFGIGCLRDVRSWIFFPAELKIEVSYDGINYTYSDAIELALATEDEQTAEHSELTIDLEDNRPVKKIRFTLINPGKCPDWHLGAGNDTWMFVDELIIR